MQFLVLKTKPRCLSTKGFYLVKYQCRGLRCFQFSVCIKHPILGAKDLDPRVDGELFLCHGTRCELRNCNCKPFHIWGTNRDLYHAQLNFFSGASLEDYGRS